MQSVNAAPQHAPRVVASRRNRSLAAYGRLARGEPSERVILLDGIHLLREARRSGLVVQSAVFTPRALAVPESASEAEALLAAGTDVMTVSERLMSTLSPVRAPSGVMAIAEYRPATLQAVFKRSPALIIIAVEIQDPGNLGAMIRAGDAGGATGLIVCGASALPLSWKALRGSMGSAFRLPTARQATAADAIRAARDNGLNVLATVPHRGQAPSSLDLSRPTAFLVGNEGSGLSEAIVGLADAAVSIPMRPEVDSLNVAIAAALLVYEASRQRSDGRSPRRP